MQKMMRQWVLEIYIFCVTYIYIYPMCTHTHTHIYIYIYIYTQTCARARACVSVRALANMAMMRNLEIVTDKSYLQRSSNTFQPLSSVHIWTKTNRPHIHCACYAYVHYASHTVERDCTPELSTLHYALNYRVFQKESSIFPKEVS